MKTPSALAQDTGAVRRADEPLSPQSSANAVAKADLVETLADTHETILMVERSLLPVAIAGAGSSAISESDTESRCHEDEQLIQQCLEVIHSEQEASVSLLQRRVRLGFGRAARILDELERRGIVGPSEGAEPRDILIGAPSSLGKSQDPDDAYKALGRACLTGDVTKVRELLAAGLDVNYHFNHQEGAPTPLHLAACNGHEAVVRLLLDKGASVDPRLAPLQGPFYQMAGATPFVLAIANDLRSVAEVLLSYGANPHAKTNGGLTGEMISEANRNPCQYWATWEFP